MARSLCHLGIIQHMRTFSRLDQYDDAINRQQFINKAIESISSPQLAAIELNGRTIIDIVSVMPNLGFYQNYCPDYRDITVIERHGYFWVTGIKN
jgi:hypothetical protein